MPKSNRGAWVYRDHSKNSTIRSKYVSPKMSKKLEKTENNLGLDRGASQLLETIMEAVAHHVWRRYPAANLIRAISHATSYDLIQSD